MRFIVLLLLLVPSLCTSAAEVVLPSGLVHRFEAEKRFGIAQVWQATLPVGGSENVRNLVLDRGWIFIQTDGGRVFALDAETGGIYWSQVFGRPNYQTGTLAASKDRVALVNGSRLFVVNRADGKEIWSRPEPRASFVQPGLSDTHIYYPTGGGLVARLKINKKKKEFDYPFTYSSLGSLVGGPITAEGNIIWATERGEIKFSPMEAGGKTGRFQTSGKMAAPLGFGRESIVAANLEGYVYCLAAYNGEQLWRASVGGGVFQAPIIVGDDVFVVTENRSLYALNFKNGGERWSVEGVEQFVAASDRRVFARSLLDELLIFDRTTGRLLASMPANRIGHMASNSMNDRLIFWSADGLVQVYRDAQQKSLRSYESLPLEIKEPASPSPNDEVTGGETPETGESPNQPIEREEAAPASDDEGLPADDGPAEGAFGFGEQAPQKLQGIEEESAGDEESSGLEADAETDSEDTPLDAGAEEMPAEDE